MSELISGKDALIVLSDGGELIWKKPKWDIKEAEAVDKNVWSVNEILNCRTDGDGEVEFYLKPKTITLNGVELPAPFEPKDGDVVYYFNDYNDCGYSSMSSYRGQFSSMGYWRTEEEIKQVVSALHLALNPKWKYNSQTVQPMR